MRSCTQRGFYARNGPCDLTSLRRKYSRVIVARFSEFVRGDVNLLDWHFGVVGLLMRLHSPVCPSFCHLRMRLVRCTTAPPLIVHESSIVRLELIARKLRAGVLNNLGNSVFYISFHDNKPQFSKMEPPPRSKSPVVPGNLFQGMSANTDWNSNNLLAPVDAMLSNSLSLADFEDATLTSANTADQQLVDSLALEMAKITLPIEWHGPAYLLIQKLLDLASPRLDDRMVESLEMDGFLDIFLSFLTRVHSEASPVVGYPPRSDFMDPDELRRSYNVMEILSSPSSASTRLVSEKTPEICTFAVDAHRPTREG